MAPYTTRSDHKPHNESTETDNSNSKYHTTDKAETETTINPVHGSYEVYKSFDQQIDHSDSTIPHTSQSFDQQIDHSGSTIPHTSQSFDQQIDHSGSTIPYTSQEHTENQHVQRNLTEGNMAESVKLEDQTTDYEASTTQLKTNRGSSTTDTKGLNAEYSRGSSTGLFKAAVGKDDSVDSTYLTTNISKSKLGDHSTNTLDITTQISKVNTDDHNNDSIDMSAAISKAKTDDHSNDSIDMTTEISTAKTDDHSNDSIDMTTEISKAKTDDHTSNDSIDMTTEISTAKTEDHSDDTIDKITQVPKSKKQEISNTNKPQTYEHRNQHITNLKKEFKSSTVSTKKITHYRECTDDEARQQICVNGNCYAMPGSNPSWDLYCECNVNFGGPNCAEMDTLFSKQQAQPEPAGTSNPVLVICGCFSILFIVVIILVAVSYFRNKNRGERRHSNSQNTVIDGRPAYMEQVTTEHTAAQCISMDNEATYSHRVEQLPAYHTIHGIIGTDYKGTLLLHNKESD